uniref:Malate dehydrogenase n=1 Tax=Angiostrongylus cantonensis TaxID=6313 RepID=A0A0K0CXI5_ANGCA
MYRFIVDCMKMQGVTESHAGQLADVLIEADVRGHYSHGLNRLDMYIGDCVKKVCRLDGTPTILKERAGSAWVDGNNLLGPVVGNFSMDLAVKKAKEAGVGWVVAKGSNHYGICGWYVLRAMKQGVMAMSFTNTSPVTYPTRSARPALGTNPLCLGADGTGGDSFVLDMATTTVAIGKDLLQALIAESQLSGNIYGEDVQYTYKTS